jgi:hypothetical protein
VAADPEGRKGCAPIHPVVAQALRSIPAIGQTVAYEKVPAAYDPAPRIADAAYAYVAEVYDLREPR